MKKLNNKGFTLIELLAVVVILAVVMGIAMTSVLSSMNKSRGGSLEDSAITIANAFEQKYTESLVDGVPSAVYSDVITGGSGYDFQSSAAYYLTEDLADEFNISTDGYDLSGGMSSISSGATGITASFVDFDATTGNFVVCLFAKTTGSYFVDNYKVGNTGASGIASGTSATAGTITWTAADSTMYACSNGDRSWE